MSDGTKHELASPTAGPPFQVGEHVVFAPITLGPTSRYIPSQELVITRVWPDSETFEFYFADDPERRLGSQGFESICRVTPTFLRWRAAWEEAFARTGSNDDADRECWELWGLVVAEHPCSGHEYDVSP